MNKLKFLTAQNYWKIAAAGTLAVILVVLLLSTHSYTSSSTCAPSNGGPQDELSFVNVTTREKGYPVKYYYGYSVNPYIDCSEFKNVFLPASFTFDILVFALPGGALAYLLWRAQPKKGAQKR